MLCARRRAVWLCVCVCVCVCVNVNLKGAGRCAQLKGVRVRVCAHTHTHTFELGSRRQVVCEMIGTLAVCCEHIDVLLCECGESPVCKVTCVREKAATVAFRDWVS